MATKVQWQIKEWGPKTQRDFSQIWRILAAVYIWGSSLPDSASPKGLLCLRPDSFLLKAHLVWLGQDYWDRMPESVNIGAVQNICRGFFISVFSQRNIINQEMCFRNTKELRCELGHLLEKYRKEPEIKTPADPEKCPPDCPGAQDGICISCPLFYAQVG